MEKKFLGFIAALLMIAVPFVGVGCAGPAEEGEQNQVTQDESLKVAGAGKKAGAVDAKKYQEDGKYFDGDDNPTYNVNAKGEWDWLTYNGNRRYHAECHVCHGFAGGGSSFAPALADSLKSLSYDAFREVVVNGRNVPQPDGSVNVMPKFGTNKNVMCFLDDLYVYLKARADGAMAAVAHRNLKKEAKSQEIRDEEAACFGD